MPSVVVVGERSRSAGDAAAAVERKTDLTVLQIDSDEVNVLDVGHVEHHSIGLGRPQFYTEFRPEYIQYNSVQYSTVQYSTVHSTQYSTVYSGQYSG